MRILVLGGTAFIGPYLVRELAAGGHDLAVFHRGETQAELPAAVAHVRGDRTRLAQSAAALRAFAPEVVVDMTCMGEAPARAVVAAFAGAARRLVLASSMDVYAAYGRLRGMEPSEPEADGTDGTDEDAPLRTVLYPYRGSSIPADGLVDPEHYDKIPAERVVLAASGLEGVVVRLPATYGPGDRQHRFAEWVRRMDDGRPVILLDETVARWRWTHGYVEDVAHGLALAATHPMAAGRVYNVGPAATPTTAERVARVGAAAGWSGRVVALPEPALPAHLRPSIDARHHIAADTSRIRGELSYGEVVAYDEGLRRTIAWERAHPPAWLADPAQARARLGYAAEDRALAEAGAA